MSSLGWLNVRQRTTYMTNVLTYKCISGNGKSPVYLRNLLSYTYDCHDRNTRNASNHSFHIPKAKDLENPIVINPLKTGMNFLLKQEPADQLTNLNI